MAYADEEAVEQERSKTLARREKGVSFLRKQARTVFKTYRRGMGFR